MTKKNFIALAKYIMDTKEYCEPFTVAQVHHLANFCHAQNLRFNRERWIAYIGGICGPNGGKFKTPKVAA
jgi:hypothetical protein